MRLLPIALVSLMTLSASTTLAKGLNKDLDYELRPDGKHVKLILNRKHSDMSASLVAVALVPPATGGNESHLINIPLPRSQPISPRATVNIGTISGLSQRIAPQRNLSTFKSVLVSEKNNCQKCDTISFAVKIEVEYSQGMKQEIVTEAYLHYLIR